MAGGGQYVSWIHDHDFVRAVELLLDRDDLDGPVNLAAPGPLPQRDLMLALRRAWGRRVGLPATAWMAEIGAWVLRTDTELLLKSRRVVPGGCSRPASSSSTPSGPRPPRTSCGACAPTTIEAAQYGHSVESLPILLPIPGELVDPPAKDLPQRVRLLQSRRMPSARA